MTRSEALDRSCDLRSAQTPLFDSVLLGGFECSTQKLSDGRRLDLLAATRHDELAAADYQRLRDIGITACRDGAPWVTVERGGSYDFTRVARMMRAARQQRIDVIWDLLHFGWPDHEDPFGARFPVHFGRYARAFARVLDAETDRAPMIAPVNEISFLAWAGGDVRCLNPFEAARGVELKAQLVRATIEAIEAIRVVLPHARFLQPEPVIRIVRSESLPLTWARTESDNLLQYQTWEMLTGRVWPSLGGCPDLLDIIGVNFYSNNQFTPDGETVELGDPRFTPFSELLLDVWRRYRRPMIVSETGHEGAARAPWLRYVTSECIEAMRRGCQLHGVTLYPIVNHPGWLDDRRCENGLWDYPGPSGERAADAALLGELALSEASLHAARNQVLSRSTMT
ncbi:MAG: beta-glucosidase [Kofleriaceae bacterium]|nr:beta-glucosidase [Kofleriaceae bacterium]